MVHSVAGYEKIGQMMKNLVLNISINGVLQGGLFADFCLERSSFRSSSEAQIWEGGAPA